MSASRFLAAAVIAAFVPYATATFAADPLPAARGTITLAPDLLEIFNDPYPSGTYSIVALDPATGELGVGVQSNTIAVGARTRWGKGGVAAIASQAGSNPLYGDMGVFLLERGWTPKEVLDFMTRGDANAAGRQVAIIDIKGNTASWTSPTNSDWKGHICGTNFCAQGNTLWGPDVVKNMGAAFEAAKGSLAERILAGLDAAEAAGGDRRGSMSAGLLILQPKAVQGFGDRVLDLRVDFSDTPVQDLRKIYDADRAGSVGNVAAMVTAKDFDGALAETGMKDLCLAGGVALNCVANGKVLRDGHARSIWIQPAAGDAGGAFGAALLAYHTYANQPRSPRGAGDPMEGALLGPQFDQPETEDRLGRAGARFEVLNDPALAQTTASLLAAGKTVGWFQGRMEFRPRALGARSILADPRSPTMQHTLNMRVKQRESFRPFAPAVLREDVSR